MAGGRLSCPPLKGPHKSRRFAVTQQFGDFGHAASGVGQVAPGFIGFHLIHQSLKGAVLLAQLTAKGALGNTEGPGHLFCGGKSANEQVEVGGDPVSQMIGGGLPAGQHGLALFPVHVLGHLVVAGHAQGHVLVADYRLAIGLVVVHRAAEIILKYPGMVRSGVGHPHFQRFQMQVQLGLDIVDQLEGAHHIPVDQDAAHLRGQGDGMQLQSGGGVTGNQGDFPVQVGQRLIPHPELEALKGRFAGHQ